MTNNLIKFLKKQKFTEDYSASELKQFTRFIERRIYKENQVILERGQINDCFHIIYSGTVNILKYDYQSRDSYPVNTLSVGEMFGAMSVIADEPISESIVADSDCELLILTKSNLYSNKVYVKFLISCTANLIQQLHEKSAKQTLGLNEETEREREDLHHKIDDLNHELNICSVVLRDTKKQLSQFYLQQQVIDDYRSLGKIIGSSHRIHSIISLIEEVARLDTTILVTGESGTGKGLIATAIHQLSNRRYEPFISVNCTAIGDDILASELFGHKRGAFHDAIEDRFGRFQMAHGGTIFLDEIGDLSPKMQAYLLRVLETGEFERVGELKTSTVDVRVIAATNCDLTKKMDEGSFRQDLYYRLNIVNIEAPPLRERKEDVPLLVAHFIDYYNSSLNRKIRHVSSEAMAILNEHDWPGNVRELRNVVERSVLLCQDYLLMPHHLPVDLLPGVEIHGRMVYNYSSSGTAKIGRRKSRISKELLQTVLIELSWNVSQAARHLDVTRQHVHRLIRKYELKRSA